MINTAIILAGGLGTRLRSVVSELPKCMAPVAGKPFLFYVIEHLLKHGVNHFIFSVGYKSETIVAYLNEHYPHLNKQFSIEDEPLGTGGAIKLSCNLTSAKNVLVLNGDTLFSVDIQQLSAFHIVHGAVCTLSLKPMQHFSRYGTVELKSDFTIIGFEEKKELEAGLINGGVYALNVAAFLNEELPQKFSFEKDYLEAYVSRRKMMGLLQDEYFVDIGIPSDFEKAQTEISKF